MPRLLVLLLGHRVIVTIARVRSAALGATLVESGPLPGLVTAAAWKSYDGGLEVVKGEQWGQGWGCIFVAT
jgi:hypothetical protein